MSSLFTDTIRKTGGTAGTDIKINNSSTYVDGSNKTTNMVNAITKSWINYNYTAQSTRDSLNFSSTTEEAAGDTTFSHTSSFNNEGYCTTFGNGGHDTSDGHWDYVLGTYNVAVGSVRVRALSVNYSSSLAEMINSNISCRGDLA
jgi:hypothetical protein